MNKSVFLSLGALTIQMFCSCNPLGQPSSIPDSVVRKISTDPQAVVLTSNAHRDQYTSPISQFAETTTYGGVDLPNGYRDVPSFIYDIDGFADVNSTGSQQIQFAATPGVNCGTDQNSISERINDCALKNGTAAIWDGTVKANAGQGVWKLVTRSALSKEVWQDQRTGLLWSSVVTTITGADWCQAAGNRETSGVSAICTISQPVAPDAALSWCAENGPTPLASADVNENWASSVYSSSKGGMGKGSLPSVRWRLPSRYDYQMADINGIRFVMPDMVRGTETGAEWSATTSIQSTTAYAYAWTFDGRNGALTRQHRGSDSALVRCVGR